MRTSWYSGSSLRPGPRYEAQVAESGRGVYVWKDRVYIGAWYWNGKRIGSRLGGDKRRTLPDDAKEGLTRVLLAPPKPKRAPAPPPPDAFMVATSEMMNLIEAARSAYERGDKSMALARIGDVYEPLRAAGEALIP